MSSDTSYINEIKYNRNFKSGLIEKISYICHGKSNVMISIFDTLKDRFIYFSDSFEENLGYCCKELCLGGWKGWFEKIDPLQASEIKKSITYYRKDSLLLRRQKPLQLEYHINGFSGDWFQLRHEIIPYRIEEEIILFNFLYDTTQHELVGLLFGKLKPSRIYNKPIEAIHISQRENEVMLLIAEGLSSKQIADQLFISMQTVLTHRKHLLEKFDALNTAQLINKAAVLQKLDEFNEM